MVLLVWQSVKTQQNVYNKQTKGFLCPPKKNYPDLPFMLSTATTIAAHAIVYVLCPVLSLFGSASRLEAAAQTSCGLFDHKQSCLCNFYSPYSMFVQGGRSYRVEGWMVVNIVGPTMLCVLIVCSYFLLFIQSFYNVLSCTQSESTYRTSGVSLNCCFDNNNTHNDIINYIAWERENTKNYIIIEAISRQCLLILINNRKVVLLVVINKIVVVLRKSKVNM